MTILNLLFLFIQILLFGSSWYICALQFIYSKNNHIYSLYLSFLMVIFIIYSQILSSDIFFKSSFSQNIYITFLIILISISIYTYVSVLGKQQYISRLFEFTIKNILIFIIIYQIYFCNDLANIIIIISLLLLDSYIIYILTKNFKTTLKNTLLLYLKEQVGSFYIFYKLLNIYYYHITYNDYSIILILVYQVLEYIYIYNQISKNKIK